MRVLPTYGRRSCSSLARCQGACIAAPLTLHCERGGWTMTLLETLALLTLIATVGFGMFDIAWKIFGNKK